jgi:Domain of Unknown Function (DUF1080)
MSRKSCASLRALSIPLVAFVLQSVVLAAIAGEPQRAIKTAATAGASPAYATRLWNFDHDRGYLLPKDWTAVSGSWAVIRDDGAPSLPNTFGLPGYGLPRTESMMLWIDSFFTTNYLIAIQNDPTEYSDFTLEAAFNPWGGAWGSYAGLVFRYTDPQNYYVLAAACPKGYLALYRMSNGRLNLIKQAPAELQRGRWYTFKVDARADHFVCYLGGKELFEAQDAGIAKGRIGVWSQNDSRVSFDNIKLTPASQGTSPSA